MDTGKKVITTKAEFLVDMLEYYCPDPENRRNSIEGRCRYYPIKDRSEGCAIGRHMTSDSAQQADNVPGETTIDNIYKTWAEFLPTWMLPLGVSFLEKCQELHDLSELWEDKGLSKSGKREVSNICLIHGIDKELVKQWL